MAPLIWMSLFLSGCIASETSIRQLSAKATNENATYDSCEKVHNTKSSRRCFTACLSRFTYFYLFGISRDTGHCYCCQNVPEGVAVSDVNLINFQLFSCDKNYTHIVLSSSRHCWRFVREEINYSSARSFCVGEGGNIIRVDSAEKQNKFQEFVVSHQSSERGVWIQAERYNGKWIYDDGTVLTYYNFAPPPNGDNGDTASNRARSQARHEYKWSDVKGIASFSFVCEVTI